MRVLLLADRSFARREHAMLRRLEVGLIDEGVRIVRAVPLNSPEESTTGLAGIAPYDDRGLRALAPSPVGAIRRAVLAIPELSPESDRGPIDIVHAWGERAWPIARRVADEFGADLCVEAWSADSLERARGFERRAVGADPDVEGVWVAPDEAIAEALSSRSPAWSVMQAPWGVHEPDLERPRLDASRPMAFCLIATGADPSAVLACIGGLADAMARNDRQALVFLDSAAVEDHPRVWSEAASLKILDRLSVIADVESRRQLVLHADAIVFPEALGEHRSILLDAMGSGMLVVAQADPLVSLLRDDHAVLAPAPTRPDWAGAFDRAFAGTSAWGTLTARARAYIRAERPAHRQVQATLAAYRSLTGGEPVPFSAASVS